MKTLCHVKDNSFIISSSNQKTRFVETRYQSSGMRSDDYLCHKQLRFRFYCKFIQRKNLENPQTFLKSYKRRASGVMFCFTVYTITVCY